MSDDVAKDLLLTQYAQMLYEHANVIGNALESVATAIDGLAKEVREKESDSDLTIGDSLKDVAIAIQNFTP